jgi:DNA integrity scanning protein DisA with diadenylate cyclase activity
VRRAVDLEGETRALETPDGVGTRHRSVYRLIAAAPEVMAIVVSQDGSVQFVAQLAGDVTVWHHSASG